MQSSDIDLRSLTDERILVATSRLIQDYHEIETNPPAGISAMPMCKNDIFLWKATICGLKDTIFAGHLFHLRLEFSNRYPCFPPVVVFKPKIFHPNVYENGSLCMQMLRQEWAPCSSVSSVLVFIQSLLDAPYLDFVANPKALKLYKENFEEYKKKAQECVQKTMQEEFDEG